MSAILSTEKNVTQCDAVCPIHGTQCRMNQYIQRAYPSHAHALEGKMCLWKK